MLATPLHISLFGKFFYFPIIAQSLHFTIKQLLTSLGLQIDIAQLAHFELLVDEFQKITLNIFFDCLLKLKKRKTPNK